jgi:hypothetical protein
MQPLNKVTKKKIGVVTLRVPQGDKSQSMICVTQTIIPTECFFIKKIGQGGH